MKKSILLSLITSSLLWSCSSEQSSSNLSEETKNPLTWTKENYLPALGQALSNEAVQDYELNNMEQGVGGTATFLSIIEETAFLHQFTQASSSNLSERLEEIAGILPFTLEEQATQSGLQFKQINPVFITWLAKNFDIQPSDQLGEQSAQDVYDNYIKKACRTLVRTHDCLDALGWQEATAAYITKCKEDIHLNQEEHLLAYLYRNYTLPLREAWGDEIDTDIGLGASFHPGIAAGFWLRRNIDGSQEELWKLLEEVVNRFDPQFKAIREGYEYTFELESDDC